MGIGVRQRMTHRVAVISDIHGNVRALDAVLTDIKRRGICDIVNLGDCAYGPFDPKPVMNRLLELDLPTVSGNEDRILIEVASCSSHSRTAAFCAERLDSRHIDWLAKLPLTLNVHGALLFHGTPTDDTQYLLTAVDESGAHPRDEQEIHQILGLSSHPLLLCGHDHTPRIVMLQSGCFVVNPGSVGCPAYTDDHPYPHTIETGTPDARYAIVEIREDGTTAELIRVTYDWNAAAQEAEANGFPNWAHWIATGGT